MPEDLNDNQAAADRCGDLPSAFLSRVAATPWALLPSAMDILMRRGADESREPPTLTRYSKAVVYEMIETWDAVAEANPAIMKARASLGLPRSNGAVAVVPIYGVIDKSRIYWADVFMDELGSLLDSLMVNDSIGSVVLDVDSLGGSAIGVPERADQIRGYRTGPKPVYTVATGDMASAAYWLGSQATKVFASPSARAGSIGVWLAHVDQSKAFEDIGFKVTLISAGKYKTEGNPFEPLGDEAKEAFQGEVNDYFKLFVGAVAKGRGVKSSAVRSGFGQGRLLTAGHALEEGLVDGIATLGQVLGAIVPRKRSGRAASALADLAIEESED